MKIAHYIFLIFLCGSMTLIAQEPEIDRTATIDLLYKQLQQIEQEEKTALRKQVENINSLLDNGIVGKEEADRLKLKAAEGRAEMIENRQAGVLETIAFLKKKNDTGSKQSGDVPIFLDIDSYIDEKQGTPELDRRTEAPARIAEPRPQLQPEEQFNENTEIRSPTTLDLVFATGLSNAVGDDTNFSDIEDETDYSLYDSRFLEFGFAIKTPLVKRNGLRIKYGASLQFNELEPSGNRYFTEIDGQTILAEFPNRLKKSNFVVSNLVFPVHLEFGPTKRKYNSKGGYYSASSKFKIGIGGYVGVNLYARQHVAYSSVFKRRLWYNARVIDGFDVNNQIYGVSGYVGFGAFSIYGKYDINTIFANGATDQRFVSLGLRIDL